MNRSRGHLELMQVEAFPFNGKVPDTLMRNTLQVEGDDGGDARADLDEGDEYAAPEDGTRCSRALGNE